MDDGIAPFRRGDRRLHVGEVEDRLFLMGGERAERLAIGEADHLRERSKPGA